MAERSLGLLLPVFAALGLACESDGGFEPEPRVLNTLVVTPTDTTLFTGAPQNTLQLYVVALDQTTAPMPGAGAATYSSSAPAIAEVSSSGLVTAVAPGTAEITTTLTLGGVTRTAPTTVTVYAIDYSGIYGVYDLTALITIFDPAWGDLTGYRYTAVLTLGEMWDPPWLIEGRYADLRSIGPGGDTSVVADTGSVTSSLDRRGRLVIELVGNKPRIGLTLSVATLASGLIDGTLGCCGHISGTFTATRR
jgi:hypothetical protein